MNDYLRRLTSLDFHLSPRENIVYAQPSRAGKKGNDRGKKERKKYSLKEEHIARSRERLRGRVYYNIPLPGEEEKKTLVFFTYILSLRGRSTTD